MRVRYSQSARATRDHFIAQREDPQAAARLYKRFADAATLLGRFPELGRIGRRPGTRELVLSGTPYVFIYRVEASAIEIVEIRHSSRKA